MSQIVPRLDTIEFDELVEQARADIPRYAPEWTDHNVHDPGMTLIDLLAWIVDQQVYRAGFVGGRHQRAFAALLGRRADGPVPAGGLVWPSRPIAGGWFIKAGSPVICRQHLDLSFVLEWSIYLPPAALARIGRAVDGIELPALASGAGGGSWAIGDSGRTAGTVVSLHFDGPLGSPDGMMPVSLGIEVAPPPGPPLSPGDRPWGPVTFSYRVGAAQWAELRVVHDGTAGLSTTGAVILEVPPVGANESSSSELRLAFDRGFFPVPPQIRAASMNVIPVVQRQRVAVSAFLVEGTGLPVEGTGQPDQMVVFDTTDLVNPTPRPHGPVLEVKVGTDGEREEPERWEERPDFSRSGPDDTHYVVRPGHLLFGNGLNGRRPRRGAQISHTELARTKGAAGNVRKGLWWSIPALGPSGAKYGLNRQPLSGGKDPTGIDDLVIAAQDAATRRGALLTDAELVSAAFGLRGMAVGRAEVLAGFDRRLPDRRVDGVRTLVVVPHEPSGAAGAEPPPGPGQAYLDEVAARLAPRRVLGERLVVQGPVIVLVDLWLSITTEPGTVGDDVRAAVENAIQDRLCALGRSETVEPWPLGRDLTIGEIEAIAVNVSGVRTVTAVRVAAAGDPPGPGPVLVPPDGLVVARPDNIEIIAAAAGSGPVHCSSRSDREGGTKR